MEKKLTQQDLVIRELATRELERRKMIRDVEYFLENYVHIENKDNSFSESRSILFKLFDEQRRALKEIENNKKNIIIKARQLGLTWLLLGYGLWNALKVEQFTVGILSQTEDYMQEAINRVEYIIERLPKWLIQEVSKQTAQYGSLYLYEKKNDEITIYFPTKEGERVVSIIKGFISTEKAGRSITADLLIFDEWGYHENAEAVFTACYPIINRPSGGKFVGISTNKRGSFFEDIVRDCLDSSDMGFNLIFLNVFADPRRTQQWYEETKKTLKSTWQQEYPETIHQALSAGELTAFPEFSPSIHVCEPFEIPTHWIRWGSVDNGYSDPFAWYKFAIDEDGTIYVYYEYTRDRNKDSKIHYSEQARKFMKDCMIDTTEESIKEIEDLRIGAEVKSDFKTYKKENLQYVVFGLDAFNTHHRDQTGKSLLDHYKEGGFNYPATRAITDRKLRKDTVHEYFKPYYDEISCKNTAKVQIFSTCTELIKYIPLLVVEDNNPNVVADNSRIDNVYDSFGYGLISSPRNASKPLIVEDSELVKYKKEKIKRMYSKRYRRGLIN